jgi:hypothetical protein
MTGDRQISEVRKIPLRARKLSRFRRWLAFAAATVALMALFAPSTYGEGEEFAENKVKAVFFVQSADTAQTLSDRALHCRPYQMKRISDNSLSE